MNITAGQLADLLEEHDGVTIPGLGNAYVFLAETGNGYLTYPSTGPGYDGAMPEDTVVVTFHDYQGEENYMLLNPEMPLEVTV